MFFVKRSACHPKLYARSLSPRKFEYPTFKKSLFFFYKPAINVADVRTPLQDARAGTGEAAGVEDRRDFTVSPTRHATSKQYLI